MISDPPSDQLSYVQIDSMLKETIQIEPGQVDELLDNPRCG